MPPSAMSVLVVLSLPVVGLSALYHAALCHAGTGSPLSSGTDNLAETEDLSATTLTDRFCRLLPLSGKV